MSNKRVHEIAKERGLPTKDVLARLKAAGVDVKASSSSVDEDVASRVLANGGQTRSGGQARSGGEARSGSGGEARSGSGSGAAANAKPAAETAKAQTSKAETPQGEIAKGKSAEGAKAAAKP